MAGSNELNAWKFDTFQSEKGPLPVTIASANTITPVSFLTILTGNTVVKTINPPLDGQHMLAIQFAGAAGVDATGNILTAKASVSGEIMLLVYNPITKKYIPVG
jgi:hypothetical protein